MLAYHTYQFAFWLATPLLGLLAWRRQDWSVVRCALVMLLGEAMMSLWFSLLMPDNWMEQPALAYALVYFVQCTLVTVRPSNKLCSFMGGLFLSGFAIAIVRLSFAGNASSDKLFWTNNLMLGWMAILVLFGGSTSEDGKHILLAAWHRFVGLARKTRITGAG